MSRDEVNDLTKSAFVKRDKTQESQVTQREAEQTIAFHSAAAPSEQAGPEKLDRPEMLGSYRIVAKLGQGGMGAVYKAVHTQLDKTVAIKVLAQNMSVDPSSTERFKREMKAIGRIQHPNVVVAHDGGKMAGEYFLVMEYVEGVDVAAFQRIHGALPTNVAGEIVRQAAIGLQHAHEMGLVHRDIKPANLMLDQRGVVKVLDLGLARIESEMASPTGSEPDANLTATGTAMGTLNYMSPEQAIDSRSVDCRTDIYSLGATLYKLLAGRLPFSGEQYDTNGKMLIAIMTGTPPSLGTIRPDLPRELVRLVDQSIVKEPDRRVATAAEFAERLQPFAGVKLAGLAKAPPGSFTAISSAGAQRSAAPVSHQSRALSAQNKYVAVGLAGSLLLCASVGLFVVFRPSGSPVQRYADAGVTAIAPPSQASQSVAPDTDRPAESSMPAADPYAVDRAVARWLPSVGGEAMTNGYVKVDPDAEGACEVGLIRLVGKDVFRASEFSKLPELPALRNLMAGFSELDSEAFSTILKCRNLHTLNVAGTRLTSTDFLKLSALPHLTYLRVSSDQVTDNWEFLTKIPTPGLLSIDGSYLPDAQLLAMLKPLSALEIVGPRGIDEKTIAAMQTANPRLTIRLSVDGKFHTLGNNPVEAAAKQLVDDGWRLSYADQRVWQPGDEVEFNDLKFVTAVQRMQMSARDAEAIAALGQIFYAFYLPECELEGLLECLNGRHIFGIFADGSAFNDAVLAGLKDRVSVGGLQINQTQVTLEGVRTFKARQPWCRISSDVAELPSEHRLPESP